MPTLERRSRLLKGNYRRRAGAIRNCALAAARRGYKVFAIQHGGWCASARYAYRTYRKYGKSNRCRNGKGGPWANDVYVLRGEEKAVCLSDGGYYHVCRFVLKVKPECSNVLSSEATTYGLDQD